MKLGRSRQRTRHRQPAGEPPAPSIGPPPDQYRRSPEKPAPSKQPGTGLAHLWLQRFGVLVLSVAVLASVVNALSLSTDVKVVSLNTGANGSLIRPASVYEAAANRDLSNSIWSRNKITVNTGGLSRALLKQFPELSSASVTVPLLAHRPVVYIATSQPVLVLVTGNGSFVVDNTGKALAAGTSPASLNPSLPVLNDQSGLHIQATRQALPASNVGFIQVVLAQLAAKQVAVSGMTLPPAASELDVHLKGQPYFVKFNLEDDRPREQVGTFLATITELHRQNVTPSQYVDVRVAGRAYYK